MNIDDIKTAVTFLYCDDRQQVILQCRYARDIPLIKRKLSALLGAPDKVIDNTFYYRYGMNYKSLRMVPMHTDVRGYRDEDLFYVAYESNEDWQTLASTAFWIGDRLDMGAYLLTDAFGLIDAYNMLIRDGMTGQQALDTLANEDFMEV